MQAKTLECQISAVLMKRFLDGDELPQELLDNLEKHLKACPSCAQIVNNEKQTIEEILDGPEEKGFVGQLVGKLKPQTVSGFATAGPGAALMNATPVYQDTPPGLAVFKNPKVLMLSIGLAIVLILMSTVLKNPTALLGPRANAGTESSTGGEEGAAAAANDSHDEESDEHSADGAETHGNEAMDDEHSEDGADSHETNSEQEDSHSDKPSEDEHLSPGKETEGSNKEHGETKADHLPNDSRVPGQPTLSKSDVIVVGGSTDSTTIKNEQKVQDTPKKNTTSPTRSKKPTTRKTTPRKKAPAKSTSKPSSSSKSSGIKVYDADGKLIRG